MRGLATGTPLLIRKDSLMTAVCVNGEFSCEGRNLKMCGSPSTVVSLAPQRRWMTLCWATLRVIQTSVWNRYPGFA